MYGWEEVKEIEEDENGVVISANYWIPINDEKSSFTQMLEDASNTTPPWEKD